MPRLYTLSEGTAARRRFPVYLVDATDGLTPETGESGGQAQISKVGGAWANTTATLTAVGNGHYYVELTATELNTLGYFAIRYKSANTAEFNMDGQVISFDLMAAVAQTGDAYARLGAPAGASVSADILAIDNLVDDLESRLGTPSNLGSGATVAANLADIEAQTDDIGVAGAGLSAIPAVTVGTINANVVTASALAADAVNEIADQVWDEAIAGHLSAGSTGEALNAAGSAGDPWTTALPGAYGAGTAGSRIGRIPDVAAGGAGGLFIAGSNAATTVNITGNLSGSVGSVTGAVGSVTGTVGSVTGNVGGNVVGSVGSIATGGIAAASFAPGAIDATAIAADAIGSSELAASAVTEIQSGLSTLDAAGVRTAVGLASANLDTQLSGIQADTDNIQTRLPAALVSGRIDASVGAMANDVFTAAALNADAVTEIFVGVLRTALSEGYAADGAQPTLEQMAYMLYSAVAQFAVTGTSISTKRIDGTTEAMVFTTDSPTAPTSRVRTS